MCSCAPIPCVEATWAPLSRVSVEYLGQDATLIPPLPLYPLCDSRIPPAVCHCLCLPVCVFVSDTCPLDASTPGAVYQEALVWMGVAWAC